jgi:hypothetical protein
MPEIRYGGTHWIDWAEMFYSDFYYEDKIIYISFRETKYEIEDPHEITLRKNLHFVVFGEESIVQIATRLFRDILEDYIRQAERVEDLIQLTEKYGRVKKVQIFQNDSDEENGIQIFEGDIQNRMRYWIEYDETGYMGGGIIR